MWWSPIFTHRSEVSLSQQKLPLGTIFKGQLAIDPSCKLTQRRIHRNMGLSVSITSPLGLTSVFLCISLYFSVHLFFSLYFSVFFCISLYFLRKNGKDGPTPLTSPLPLSRSHTVPGLQHSARATASKYTKSNTQIQIDMHNLS